MKVLLVSCYELGHQPLHVASAAGFLRAGGHEVRATDLAVEHLDEEALRWADMVAVAVPMHTAMRLAGRVVERARALRGDGVRIALFGLYAPLAAADLEARVDDVVGGEHEEELTRIASGEPTGRAVVLDRLRFALPVRDVLPPLERYARLRIDGEERLAGYVEATRGCVHRCRHCPVPVVYDGRIRVVQLETLLADVERLRDMGARHLTFGDPDFLNAPTHALRVVRAVHAGFPDLTFDVTTKVEHILRHRSLLPELAASGLVFVVSAVESMSETVLRILDKGHSPAQARDAVRLLRGHGVEARPSLLPFTPWTRLADLTDLVDFVDEEDLVDSVDPVQLTIRLLLPRGSLLLRRPEVEPYLDGYDGAALSWRWRHPDPDMDTLQRDLAAAVAEDADAGADPRSTHERIRALVDEAARRAGSGWHHRAEALSAAPASRPRLTEAWFC